MTTWTCYPDTGWCGLVPVVPTLETRLSEPVITTGLPHVATTTIPTFTTTTKKATTRTRDDKPTQTKDAPQSKQTQRTEFGEESTTPPPTTETSLVTRQTDGNVVQTVVPSVAPESVSSGSEGISKGAAAGIAIAAAVVGGAIAFAIAFILFKRRGRQLGRKHSESTTAFLPPKREHPAYVQISQSIPPMTHATTIPTSDGSLDLSNLSHSSDFLAGVLPLPADEEMVKRGAVALFDQIHQHIDNFYRDVHATLTPTMESDLRKFGESSVDLADEFKHSATPTLALKHALTVYVLGIVAPEADQRSTLFPIELSGLKENERSVQSSDDLAAYIVYRRLAVRLHSPPLASLQSRHSDIYEAAEHFALTFFPWANPIYADKEKDENLADIITSALNLSMWLFGQPYLYEWVWEDVGRRGTVLAPGLIRVTDASGRMMREPVRITDSVVANGG